jgi:hypothetical protein
VGRMGRVHQNENWRGYLLRLGRGRGGGRFLNHGPIRGVFWPIPGSATTRPKDWGSGVCFPSMLHAGILLQLKVGLVSWPTHPSYGCPA